jgi:hypothetical protein
MQFAPFSRLLAKTASLALHRDDPDPLVRRATLEEETRQLNRGFSLDFVFGNVLPKLARLFFVTVFHERIARLAQHAATFFEKRFA